MSDIAHSWTDAQIAEMEKELKKYYQDSYNEIAKEMREILSKMNLNKNMTASELYAEARKYERLETLENQLTESLKSVNSDSVKMINGKMVNVYQTNFNWNAGKLGGVVPLINKEAIKSILAKDVSPFQMLAIDNIKDSALIRNKLTNQLVNGIVQGDSINGIAKRIRSVYESNLSDSIRIARTETTQVEARGRYNVGEEAKELGFKVYKKWVATKDSRTRDAHVKANGQIVPQDEPFIVGGEKMMYPGDSSLGASAENVINCRCTMVTILK